jgi:hypothetical protein
MDLGEIIGDSFKYPVSNWKRLLILGIIVLISQLSMEIIMLYASVSGLLYFLVIPALVASLLMMGYQLRTIKTTILGEIEPPEFKKWSKMLIDGLKMFLVALIYQTIPVIVLIAGFVMLLAGSSATKIFGLLIMLLGLFILIIVGIIMVMAISNMAYYGEIGAALRFGEIKRRIESIGWLNYIMLLIILMVIYILIAVAAALLSLIPFVGLVLTCLIAYPFMYLFMYRAYGLIFRETLEEEEFQNESDYFLETEETYNNN